MTNPDTFYLAACILVDANSRVLLLHRNADHRVQWELPAARVDPAEDAHSVVAAQLKEELGIDVEVRHLLGETHFSDEGITMHFAWFATHIAAGQPRLHSTAYDEIRYFSVDELKAMHHELSSNARRFVDAVTRGDIRVAPLA